MRRGPLVVLVVLLALVGYLGYRWVLRDEPVEYADDLEHFKYGSVGSEPGGSLLAPVGGLLPPYWVFRVLPKVCSPGMPSYPELGLIFERDRDGTVKDLPIGISRRRRLGFDMVGVNCAFCHLGTVRDGPGAEPRIVPGMPPQQPDVQRLFRAIFDCVESPQFTAAKVVEQIRASGGRVGLVDAIKYRLLMPRLRGKIASIAGQIGVLTSERVPPSGPGRLDTVNPGKAFEVGWNLEEQLARDGIKELTGMADFPPVWNLRRRWGMRLHWDGNIGSTHEAILSAVLAVGAMPETVDRPRLERVVNYLFALRSPAYPYDVNRDLAARGRPVFERHCAECHDFQSPKTGTVTPISTLGTDPHRLDAFSGLYAARLPEALNRHYAGSEFHFKTFRKTDGYVNVPLDGVWARAPYLHNGSVPTLRDLLEPERCRPPRFSRGSDVYDPENAGFVSDAEPSADRSCPPRTGARRDQRAPATGPAGARLFRFETGAPGNRNSGHLWGTDLPADQKDALVEFLKTL